MNLFRTQIEDKTQEIRDEQFQVTEARVVPSIESKDLTFSNSGKAFYATIQQRGELAFYVKEKEG